MCKQQPLEQQQLATTETNDGSITEHGNRRGSCPTSVTSSISRNIRLDQYQSNCIRSTRRKSAYDPDHNFEWYDLDAIGQSRNNKLDFHAGMVFTTEQQILREGVQGNLLCNPLSVNRRDSPTFFWATRETKEDRDFRARMQKLELEIDSNSSSLSLSSGSSHSSTSIW